MNTIFNRLFPNLPAKEWKNFNLNDAYLKARELDMKLPEQQSQLIPSDCYTFGGFGEYRTDVWKGFEPDAKEMIHLGVDFNGLKEGQEVASLSDGVVVYILFDTTLFNGWGGKVIIHSNNLYYLYGHLAKPTLIIGQEIKRGDIIGCLAPASANGGWFVHLHLQVMKESFIKRHKSYEEVDGYAFETMPNDVVDPMKLD